MITSSLNSVLAYGSQFLMVFQLKFEVKDTDTLFCFIYGSKFKVAPHRFIELAARWCPRT